MMASAMVSGLQVLNGPRSRKRKFCMTPWPVAQAFCHSACNWYWYVSRACQSHLIFSQLFTNEQETTAQRHLIRINAHDVSLKCHQVLAACFNQRRSIY